VFPAVDALESLSRLMPDIVAPSHMESARKIRRLLARYEEMELLMRLGEIKPGADPDTDRAIAAHDDIMEYLQQRLGEPEPFDDAQKYLEALARQYAA
jgi:type III secretion protein N (ATPase)